MFNKKNDFLNGLLDLLHAVVTHGTLQIDRYDRNTRDKATAGSHRYSDKAPGTSVVALPAFAASAWILRVFGEDPEAPVGWLATSWAGCAWSQGVQGALGGACIWSWLRLFVTQRAALVTVLAMFLGGMPLPYCTLMFSHAQVIGLIGASLWTFRLFGVAEGEAGGTGLSLRKPAAADKPESRGRMALAGFCLGLALASEYTAGIVVVALGVYMVLRRRAGWAWFVLGAVPPLLLIPAYSWATVGSPFSLPYSYQASFPEMQKGLYAIQWPNAETAFNLLFSPERGLFFWSPFLLMAGSGYAALARRSTAAFCLMYAVPLVQVIVISGRVWDWQAGSCFGPRYLAPMLPLLALPCALGVQRWPKLGMALAAYSITITTLATLTDACFSYNLQNPLTEQVIPDFLEGKFSYNLGMTVLGLPPYASVALYYIILIGGIWWLWRRLPDERAGTLEGRTADDAPGTDGASEQSKPGA